jgi:trimethylamine:corrinoid methyltransferase-like protein
VIQMKVRLQPRKTVARCCCICSLLVPCARPGSSHVLQSVQLYALYTGGDTIENTQQPSVMHNKCPVFPMFVATRTQQTLRLHIAAAQVAYGVCSVLVPGSGEAYGVMWIPYSTPRAAQLPLQQGPRPGCYRYTVGSS